MAAYKNIISTRIRTFGLPLLLAASLLLAYSPLLAGRFYAVGDAATVFIPLEFFFRTEQTAGRLPAWLPDTAWGFPAIAAAQIGFFYPPLLLSRHLPLPLYLSGLVFLHAAAALAGMYCFCRQLQYSRPAASLGALSYALGGYVTLHLTHLNIFFAAAWLPWQLALIKQQQQHPRPPREFTARFALLLSLPFLAGQLQVPLMMAVIAAAYFLVSSPARHPKIEGMKRSLARRHLSTLAILTAAAALAIALAAAQLLPTLELARHSNRSHGGEFNLTTANQYSYPLYHLPTLLFPRFYGNDNTYWGKRLQIEYGFYMGSIPLALAAYALANGTERNKKTFAHIRDPGTATKQEPAYTETRRRRTAEYVRSTLSGFWEFSELRFFRWLFLLSFLLALGSLSPFRLIGIEPSLWFFSAPARWLLLTSFSLSVLAANGFDVLIKQPHTAPRLCRRWLIATLCIILLANTALALAAAQPESFWQQFTSRTDKIASLFNSARNSSVSVRSLYTWIPPFIFFITWIITAQSNKTAAAASPLLPSPTALAWPGIIIFLTAAELALLTLTATPHYSWHQILKPPETVNLLPQNIRTKNARVYTIRNQGDTGAYFTDPASRPDYRTREQLRRLLPPLVHSQFNILGVEWPASLPLQSHTDLLDTVRQPGGYTVSDLDKAAALNIGAILAPDNGAVTITPIPAAPRFELRVEPPLYQLEDESDPEDLREDPAPSKKVPGTFNHDTLTIEKLLPTRQTFIINTKKSANLIIRDSYYPGWHATVDGMTVSVQRTEDIFRRIDLPAGRHTLVLEYKPVTLLLGIIVSLGALLATLPLLAILPAGRSLAVSN
ncbi:MAG: hypothetical protein COT71_00035 [Candidatus Andersenbacteria bacterium CG10_big_fil_rev_8_21_14_0_10_54_11]|uniref:Membrane protein 6-pyruvoyl-tetrahydropterin synthase-related domain-containing protein n=1 Tax=Candidatus Andersenbacteria bacterium CG10_big_fil_rev_8_21_14_0_10_54_11 TaxID=1974485 RepID=A0A2M6X0G1_9BACT|nr:MAG: hypothetical protein COT71_00035 [Candidatus Andersenbacteria bacterium CG10_big_fil_rev_8_21_14_0_10_54_11]